MNRILISLITLIAGGGLSPLGGKLWAQEWTVQDIILPIPEFQGTEAGWGAVNPLGDFNSDGKSDFMLVGTNILPAGFPVFSMTLGVVMPGLGEEGWKTLASEFGVGRFIFSGGWWLPHVAVLRTPTELWVAIKDQQNNNVILLDSTTGGTIAVAENPIPVPGQNPVTGWLGVVAAGDLNQDGYEDLFLEGFASPNYRVIAGVDGRTGQIIWDHYEANDNGVAPTIRGELTRPGDLDGDSIPDYVSSFNTFDPLLTQAIALQIAFSGASGSIIWRNEASNESMRGGNIGGKDVNGDGVEDFLWNRPNTVQMTDGATGAAIWAIGTNYLDHLFPPGAWSYYSTNPSFYSGVPGSSSSFELVQHIVLVDTVALEEHRGFAHLDAMTGAFLRWEDVPSDMEPWFPDTTDYGVLNEHYLMGDIDRDGYTEIFHTAPITAYDNPNIINQPRPGLIYSQKTLRVAESHPVGQPLVLEADFPSSPGKPFRILLSDEFGLVNGLMIDEWRTNLVSSPLLDFSLSASTMRGTLDSQGQGAVALAVPPNPSLSGRTIFSRAVVLESPGSREIWSVSTLGVTELQ